MVRTVPGSPAERAGLHGAESNSGRLADVIVAVNGKPVHRLPDLTDELERAGVGKRVTLQVKRDGQERSVDVDVVDIGRRR